jgi:hypothetical protein
MPPAATTVAPPTATLSARSYDDLPPAYEAFDDTAMDAAPVDAPDPLDDGIAAEDGPLEVDTSDRSTGPGFPSTADVRDVPEPRTVDDEPERPSPVARSERSSRLAARISSRR